MADRCAIYLARRGSPHPIRPGRDLLLKSAQRSRPCPPIPTSPAGPTNQAQAPLRSHHGQGRRQAHCGYGAPGKGNTLLNYCGIGTDFLDFTVDRNPYKHGRYTPGMHIPIKPVEAIDRAKPDYILILPWNLKQEIVQQMRHVGEWGAKFIVPIPEIAVIDPRDVGS